MVGVEVLKGRSQEWGAVYVADPRARDGPGPDRIDRVNVREFILLASMACVLGGCASYDARFDSPDPTMRMLAIVESSGSNADADYPHLVAALDDGDPEVRLLAIRVLERRTGTTRGFDWAAPAAQRAGALKEWKEWAEQYVTTVSSVGSGATARSGSRPRRGSTSRVRSRGQEQTT